MLLEGIHLPTKNEVTGWIYVPAIAEPEGIVQLVHGFGEHSRLHIDSVIRQFNIDDFAHGNATDTYKISRRKRTALYERG